MSIVARILLFLLALIVLGYILHKIRKKRVHIYYAIYWTFFAIILLVISIFPEIYIWIAGLCGIKVPVHLLLMGICILLMVKLFNDTLRLSDLEKKVESLTQEIALRDVRNIDKNVNE